MSGRGAKSKPTAGGRKRNVQEASKLWLGNIKDWFPERHSTTYFLPPIRFNRVPYGVRVIAGESVLERLPPAAANSGGSRPQYPDAPSPAQTPRPVAGSLWPQPPPTPSTLAPVQQSDVQCDEAMTRILHCLRGVAREQAEVMMVLSELKFKKYLADKPDAVSHKVWARLPKSSSEGDFDIMIIHRQYGLVSGEVKSVGAGGNPTTGTDLIRVVEKALKQLKKGERELKHLVSDLPSVAVSTVLMLPNVSSSQLVQALASSPAVSLDLCNYYGVSDVQAVAKLCLLSDDLPPAGEPRELSGTEIANLQQWWSRTVARQVSTLTESQYDELLARFCGPATTVEVPTVTPPRRALRTHADAVAETGERWSALSLYPDQIDILEENDPCAFLHGPPGTGKTLLLVLRAMQWIRQERIVHIVAAEDMNSKSSIHFLLEGSLRDVVHRWSSPAGVHLHQFTSAHDALPALAKLTRDGELCVVIDEIDEEGLKTSFPSLVRRLSDQVPSLRLWAAGLWMDKDGTILPSWMTVHRLHTPLRCPPAVHRHVEESCNKLPMESTKVISEEPGDASQQAEIFTIIRTAKYGARSCPPDTDGPPVLTLRHRDQEGLTQSGHSWGVPQICKRCGEAVVEVLRDLRVGLDGPDGLHYRDVFILFDSAEVNKITEDSAMVKTMRGQGVPVGIVKPDDMGGRCDMARAVTDQVTITDHNTASGLERRVVVAVVIADRPARRDELIAKSRCTAQLVLIETSFFESFSAPSFTFHQAKAVRVGD
ncbi:uncharacterized protein LOC143278101 [Babylonia areolata]|uniref:uncharacterized protein LOC143278101 n=1 Tax=Babylonia areolata TaxID=304850 RepID=UPI003FD6639F